MTELFRERDYTRVGYFQTVLESEGIATFVRNQDLVTMTTDVPIPDMFPALCILKESDYERAMEILKHLVAPNDASSRLSEEPVKGVFVIGIAMIFGGIAFGQVVRIVGQVISEDSVAYEHLAFRGSVALGTSWILWMTLKRWRLEKVKAKAKAKREAANGE